MKEGSPLAVCVKTNPNKPLMEDTVITRQSFEEDTFSQSFRENQFDAALCEKSETEKLVGNLYRKKKILASEEFF